MWGRRRARTLGCSLAGLGRLAGLRPCGDILVWIYFGLGVGVCWLIRDA
jgi:hypothetical protein